MPCRLSLTFLVACLAFATLGDVRAATHDKQPENGSSAAGSESLPDWAKADRQPLWSFAWVSDMHLDGSRLEYTAKAFRHIDSELKPHFVLFSGDNNAQPAPPADPEKPESMGVRQQRFLKSFLQEHLKAPYVLITADNWTEGFNEVFGPHQYSFDCGGLHFILLDPDRVYHGRGFEGLSAFNKTTWEWLKRDLDRNRESPTVVALHEPICPATFLDARALRNLLNRYPNVVAVLQGHLHVDIDRRRDGRAYLTCPSLGKPPVRGMKLVQVHPEGLVLRTVVYKPSDDRFEMTDRRQCIEIPKPLGERLAAPGGPKFVMSRYDAVPAHPIVSDPTLVLRMGELFMEAANSMNQDMLEPTK